MKYATFAMAVLFAVVPAYAQVAEAEQSIVITAPKNKLRVLPPEISLDRQAIAESQRSNMADLLRGMPGVSAKTNSRGETIARVRGAEERQTAVFFDGAPFGVPWDGRVDLGILPTGLIDRLNVAKGPVPIEYGSNAVAGAVDLVSRRYQATANGFTGLAEVGPLGVANASGVATFGNNTFDVTLAGGYLKRDALSIAKRNALPFSQDSADRRSNSDLESVSAFAAIGVHLGKLEARLSVLHNETERGISPESDRNPALAAPRFWRYPSIKLTQMTMNAKTDLAPDVTLVGVLYRQWFDQKIDSYRTIAYTTLSTSEDDDDNTVGGRLTLSNKLGPANLRWSGSVQTTNHKQVDTPFPSAIAGPRLEFEQKVSSLGAEADIPVTHVSQITLGAAFDQAKMPKTGDKPAQANQDANAWSASFRHSIASDLTFSISSGQRTRFATARELFGEALGRFLINPELRPEKAWLTDAELRWTQPGFNLTLNPFYIRGKDTISQRMVRVNSVTLRQRFNLGGTRTYGIDAAFSTRLSDTLGLALTGSVLNAEADPGDAAFRRLVQRPNHELSAVLDYTIAQRYRISAELLHTGSAEDDSPVDGRVKLPSSTEINLRGSWTLANLSNGGRVSLTAAGENLNNALVLPQLGLPRPGRTLRVGIRID